MGQVMGYCVMFENIRKTFPNHITKSRDSLFGSTYRTFLTCQGRCVELGNRLNSIEELILYVGQNILMSSLGTQRSTQRSTVSEKNYDSMRDYKEIKGNPLSGSHPVQIDDEVLEELEEAKEAIEDLEVELFGVMQQKDRTPGALLFFTMLHDPNYLEALQQLILQMNKMKPIASGESHIPFNELRKRLLVCIGQTPLVEKLIFTYSNMHARWTQSRFRVFNARSQAGTDSDTSFTCPLCNHDARAVKDGNANNKEEPKSQKQKKKSRASAAITTSYEPVKTIEMSQSMTSLPNVHDVQGERKKMQKQLRMSGF